MALTETFTHKGQTWRRYGAEPLRSHFIVGVDLGQASDPTAVCVLEHHRTVKDTWSTTQLPGGGGIIRQDSDERFDVRHLARLPLGLSYVDIVHHCAGLLMRPPLAGEAKLVLDETGVGRPVADLFDDAGLKPVRLTITAGLEPQQHSERSWGVPKHALISTLDARLNTGEFRVASELTESGALAEELKDFRRKVSVAGRYSYEARVGKHDDLVLACAISLWVACNPPPKMYIGSVIGHY